MKDQITINGQDGTFGAYIARPETLPAPAVMVLQEVFGVNADIREKCDELAEQGFLAVAPDLSGVKSRASISASVQRRTGSTAFASIKPMTEMLVLGTLRTPPTPWRVPECTGKIAVLGYCLGALMTFLTACATALTLRSPTTVVTLRSIWARSMVSMRPC